MVQSDNATEPYAGLGEALRLGADAVFVATSVVEGDVPGGVRLCEGVLSLSLAHLLLYRESLYGQI